MALESFRLFVPVDQISGHTVEYVPCWDVANAIVATLPTCVRHIYLVLDMHIHPDDLEDIIDLAEWPNLTRALRRLPDLESVTFCGGYNRESTLTTLPQNVIDLLTIFLGDMRPHGILKFY